MIKSITTTNPAKQAIGKARRKVGEAGELVGENAGEIFADAIFCGKAEIQRILSPPEW